MRCRRGRRRPASPLLGSSSGSYASRHGERGLHDRAPLRPALRRAVLRAEPARARDQRDQRPRAGHRRLLGRPDDVRLQAGVRRRPKGYLDQIECEALVVIPGNHDSRNVGYVHFEELFGERNSVAAPGRTSRSSRSTRPSPTSTTARSAAAATAGSRSSSPTSRACASSCCHHHLLPVPGTGRERNVVYDAGDAIECLQRAGVQPRALRPQARAVRVAAREPLRRQRGHGLVAAAPRATRGPVTTSSRSRAATSTSGASTRSTGRSGSSSSRSTRSSTRSTRRDRGRGDDARR